MEKTNAKMRACKLVRAQIKGPLQNQTLNTMKILTSTKWCTTAMPCYRANESGMPANAHGATLAS